MESIVVKLPARIPARMKRLRNTILGTSVVVLTLGTIGALFLLTFVMPDLSVLIILPFMLVLTALAIVIFLPLVWRTLDKISDDICSRPGLRRQDEALHNLIKIRLRRTSFFEYGRVLTTMQRIRLSEKRNADGTLWMMETDEHFSKLIFTKYRPGEIKEPNDPEDIDVMHPTEVILNHPHREAMVRRMKNWKEVRDKWKRP